MYLFRKQNNPWQSHLEIKGNNFFFILFSLLVFIFSWPLLSKLQIDLSYIFSFFVFLIFFSCIYSIGEKNKFALAIATGLILLITLFKIAKHRYDTPLIVSIWALLNILFFLFVTIILLIHILTYKKISLNEIYGSICVYLFIGIIWGIVYALIAYFDTNAFHISAASNQAGKDISQYFYYSFITLTSVGYGDIFPINSWARIFAVMEGIVGQIYAVILIGWLIGNLLQARRG